MNKIRRIIEQIEKHQKLPLQNKGLLIKYLKSGKVITLYDFECPPRFINRDHNGNLFINYLVDLKKIFNQQKIDKYSEIPRAIKNKKGEIQILNFFLTNSINIRFVKIIADTNLDYITPNSKKFLGTAKIKKHFQKFKKLIQKECRNYPASVHVILFSDLIKKFKKDYELAFNYALRNNLVSSNIFKQQIARTKNHVGITTNEASEFSRRTIATYAAEGVIFDKLSNTKNFSQAVWLNTAEADKRTIIITNCLRLKRKMGRLPMVFLSEIRGQI